MTMRQKRPTRGPAIEPEPELVACCAERISTIATASLMTPSPNTRLCMNGSLLASMRLSTETLSVADMMAPTARQSLTESHPSPLWKTSRQTPLVKSC